MDQYKILAKIAVSPAKVVYKAVDLDHSTFYAIKSVDLDKTRANLDAFFPSIFSGHRNILAPLCTLFVPGNLLWVVKPYISAGSLQSFISSSAFPDGLPEPIIAEILKQTLNALSFLHKNGNYHRNIKSGNILVDSNGLVKIADFGVYKPGSKKDRSLYPSADIWSLGITAMELALGRSPLLFSKREKSKSKKLFSKDFKDLVASCLNQDPSKRPSAENLLNNHSFFKNCKGRHFLIKNLLQNLPSVEERFKQSSADCTCSVGEDDDDGLKGEIAKICGWNFDEDEFELVPIFATEPPQEQDDDDTVVVKRLRSEFAGSGLSSLGQDGEAAKVVADGGGSGELVVEGNLGERTLDGLIQLKNSLDEQRMEVINLINLVQNPELGGSGLNSMGRVGDEAQVGGGDLVVDGMILLKKSLDEQRMKVINLINVLGGEVTEDDVPMQVIEKLRLELESEKEKNYGLELELKNLKRSIGIGIVDSQDFDSSGTCRFSDL